MVKVTSIILASLAAAPIAFAAPAPELHPEQTSDIAIRSEFDDNVIEARAPEPFMKFIRKIKPAHIIRAAAPIIRKAVPIIRKAMPYAGMAARLILRDENGDLYVRDIDISELTERDLEELAFSLDVRGFEDADELEFETREPKFRVKKLMKKGKGLMGGAMKLARFTNPATAALSLAAREFEEDEFFDAREYYEDIEDIETREPKRRKKHLEARDFEDIEDVEVREPKRRKKQKQVEAREFEDEFDELLERDFEDYLDELEARDPRVNWRHAASRGRAVAGRARHIAGKAINTFDRASSFLKGFGIREFDDEDFEMEARSLDELD